MNSKSQKNGVQDELRMLRQKQLASNQRHKLKDLSCKPLTTPEEAATFLATMREAQHRREYTHKPPSNLTADGMDAWYLRQKKEEQTLKLRRKEAERLLRNYRSGMDDHAAHMPSPRESGSLNDPSDHTGSEVGASSVASSSAYGYAAPSPTKILNSAALKMKSEQEQQKQDHRTLEVEDMEEKKVAEEETVLSHVVVDPNPAVPTPSAPSPFSVSQHKPKPSLLINTEESPPAGSEGTSSANFAITEPPVPEQRESLEAGVVVVESDIHPPVEETVWRDFISLEPGAKFPPEEGRYHLYCSYACPGSHRALIVRALKGLDKVISVTYLHPVWRLTNPDDPQDKHRGWVFGNPLGDAFTNTIAKGGPFPPAYDSNEPDPHCDAFSIRDVYECAQDTSGKFTIPLLWDTKLKTIVNNESSDIAYMFNSCFNHFCDKPELDLYTEDDAVEKAKLSEVSEWISPLMIHGVYRCGFAKTQWAYDRAINDLCAAFDRADDTLEQSRFLTGDALTDVDIRLFVTLLRFDEVYTTYFKANARLVMLTPSLLNFCRDIFQLPGVAETCNMEQIKAHFFASHAEWNKYSVIPRGLGFMELLDMPHDRDKMVLGGVGDDDRSVDGDHSAPGGIWGQQ